MTDLPTYAVTLWQPWAWAVIFGGKNIENRSRRINPCHLLIHAGLTYDDEAVDMILDLTGRKRLPELATRGGFIIGRVTVTDSVYVKRATGNPWGFSRSWHWHLEGPQRADPFIVCRGFPGLWRPPENWERSFPVKHPRRRR